MKNNEIKEMIKVLKSLGNKQASELYYYITNLQEQLHQASLDIQELTERDIECPSWCDKLTNLQQENERLKRKLTTKKLFKKHKVQTPENFEIRKIFELQQRIEKAVEYIKEHTFQEEIGFDNKKGEIHYGYFVECKAKELLNILNGDNNG